MQLDGGNILPLSGDEFHDLMMPLEIGEPKNIAVAVSGGGDSMALALLLHQWCLNNHVKLHAVTVDHGLRKASKQEAKDVSKWLEKLNIHHEILSWIGEKPTSNIQDKARKARYDLISKWCKSKEIDHVFVAHHKDDQAETFLIRLFRGSGVDGLSAMEKVSRLPVEGYEKDAIKIYRPLLSIGKERLLKTLEEMGQTWVTDPSNENEAFTRIKIRKLLNDTQIEGLDRERLTATATKMSRVKSLLDQLTDHAESELVNYHPLGYAELSRNFSQNLHEEIALRLLSRLLKKVSGAKHPGRYQKLFTLFENLKQVDFSGQTLCGVIVYKNEKGQIIFVREAVSINDEKIITDKKQLLWDNRFIVNSKETSGKVIAFSNEMKVTLFEQHPEVKGDIYKNFESHVLRDKLLQTLPIILTNDEKIILPNFLFADKNQIQVGVFSASFQH
ncbi:MAG: tRNA lysidine(34) synthetase TilS [Kordiimonadaceae bacterium]|jgi:tRNA(Ile)-lysidine synthase|nr:tRNA lysidine(34) synthetase TilS [Kordiimonadaceae bacterium]